MSGLGERHPHLDAVDPHELIAGSLVGLLDAIDQPCSLGLGSGDQDECQGGDGYGGDADDES